MSSNYQVLIVGFLSGCTLLVLVYMIYMARRFDKLLMKENIYLIQLLQRHFHKLSLDEQREFRKRFAKTIDQQ